MTRYEQGFMRKCAEYGVDGRIVLGKIASANMLQRVGSRALEALEGGALKGHAAAAPGGKARSVFDKLVRFFGENGYRMDPDGAMARAAVRRKKRELDLIRGFGRWP